MKKFVLLSCLFLNFYSYSFALTPQEYCEVSKQNTCVTPYGKALGQYENVIGFSNCRSECVKKSENKVPAKDAKTSEDVYSGLAWQCVEYARRWWILERGIRFGSIDTSDQIFSLTEATRLIDDKKISLNSLKNSSKVPPKVGDLLIYKKQENNPNFHYGHVAVIVGLNLNSGYVDVAEQNYDNKKWESPHKYSRRISLELKNNEYTVYDIPFITFNSSKVNSKEKDMILGWVSPEF